MSTFTDALQSYGQGQLSPNNTLRDSELASALKRYKRTVAKRYRIVDPESMERHLPDGQLHISTKVDGQLWFLAKREGEVALISYNGRVLLGVPVVEEAAKLLANAPNLLIAGELFAIPTQGEGRPTVHHVNRALGQPELAKTLGFKAFDLVREDGEDRQSEAFEDRWERLTELLSGGKRVAPVTTVVGDSKEAAGYYSEWVRSEKFEGLIARSEYGLTYKVKPTIDIDAVVIAYGESVENEVYQVRELTVALMRDDGSLHICGTVGGGFSTEDRIHWHKRLSEMQVESSFRMANREGTLCRFVRPEIVIEIKIGDLMATDASDQPIRRMTLEYSEDEGYSALKAMPIPSLIFPVFQRERADKSVDVASIGLEQVYRHLPFAGRDESPEVVELPESEVISREVYAKSLRGGIGIRKFVAIQTHKSETDERYPPFVLFSTDFSPGRKDPMKNDLTISGTREGLEVHISEWRDKNVKRGWVDPGELLGDD